MIASLQVLLLGFVTLSFVPPSEAVLKKWTRQTERVRTIHIRQKTTFFHPSFPRGSAVVPEEIWIKRPHLYRKTSTYPKGKIIVVVGSSRAARRVSDHVQLISVADALDPLGVFYTYADVGRQKRIWREEGVNLSISRWVLQRGQVQLEVGDAAASRLEFSKETWFPTGAVLNGKRYEFEIARPSPFKIPYPSRIRSFEGDRLVEETEVLSVKVNVPVRKTLFDLRLLRARPQKK